MAKDLKQQPSRSRGANFAVSALQHYARQLRGYLRRRLRQPSDIDDLAQEVYLRLLQTDPGEIKKPLSFLLGVAAHVVADHWSAESKNRTHFPPSADKFEICGDLASEALRDRPEDWLSVCQQVDEALSGLPPMHAAVLILHKRDGLSYEEVSQRLGLSVHTVHKYLTTARAQIRMAYADE